MSIPMGRPVLGVIGGVFVLVLVGAAYLRPAAERAPAVSVEVDSTPSEEEAELMTRREGVGWVFGRMIGFPGADRPLVSPRGAFGGNSLPPP